MNKKIFFALFFSVTSCSLWAQTKKPLDAQMEVVRDYEPTINEAKKIDIKPEMMDTVKLRPEIRYDLKSFVMHNKFTPKAIKAAGVNIVRDMTKYPFYIKAGLGLPLQSTLDANYSLTINNNTWVSAYVNHYGNYSHIKNDLAIRSSMFQNNNHVGVSGAKRWSDFSIYTNIEYGNDVYSRYAEKYNNKITFNSLDANLILGTDFIDLSHLNFRLKGNIFSYNNGRENSLNATAILDLEQVFAKKHDVALSLHYDRVAGTEVRGSNGFQYPDMPSYRSPKDIVTIIGTYGIQLDTYKLQIGVTSFMRTDYFKAYVYPKINLEKTICNKKATIFIDFDSRQYSSDYRRNPYLYYGSIMPVSVEINGYLGVRGCVKDAFTYNVYGGYSYTYDYGFYSGNATTTTMADVKNLKVSASLGAKVSRYINLNFEGEYNYYKLSTDRPFADLPAIWGSLGADFQCSPKLSISTKIKVLGKTNFYQDAISVNTLGTRVDLSAKANYVINKQFTAFIELNNITNSKLYQFNHYRLMGINGFIGVKYRF